jgi:hypothetical protein
MSSSIGRGNRLQLEQQHRACVVLSRILRRQEDLYRPKMYTYPLKLALSKAVLEGKHQREGIAQINRKVSFFSGWQ